jgi:YbbR domain-containing protein
VRVRGTAGIVGSLEPGDVAAVLDLSDERPGQRLFDLFSGRILTPSRVEVTSVVPASVTLTLERIGLARTVPVVPDIVGQPAEGFVVGRITTEPRTVEIVGPETTLQQLGEALTEPVSVADARQAVEEVVTVGVADPTLRLAESVSARVMVEIVAAPLERTVHDVPVRLRLESASALIEPDRITVGIRGSREAVHGFEIEELECYVDLAGLRPGRYNLPVTIESTGEIQVMHIDPPFVRITLR